MTTLMRRLLLYIFLMIPLTIGAQQGNVYSRSITVMDGLANNTVRHVIQDHRGFLWFATLDGVNRYDGYTLTTVRQQSAGTDVSNRNVKYLMEDAVGNIWMQLSGNNYACYNPRTEQFYALPPIVWQKGLFKSIACCDDGSVLLYSPDGNCCLLHMVDGRWLAVSKRLPFIRQVDSSDQRGFYIATGQGLMFWQQGHEPRLRSEKQGTLAVVAGRFVLMDNGNFIDLPGHRRLLSTDIRALSAQVVVGRRWFFCTPQGVMCYDMQQNRLSSVLPLRNALIEEDHRGHFLVYNDANTCYIYSNGTFHQLVTTVSDKPLNYPKTKYNIAADRFGNIWVTAFGRGLFCYHPDHGTTDSYVFREGRHNFTSNNLPLWMIADHNGNIWVTSEMGGAVMLMVMPQTIQRLFPAGEDASDYQNAVRTLIPTGGGTYSVSTRLGTVYDYDLLKLKGQRVDLHFVYCATRDRLKKLWLGTRGNGIKAGDEEYRHDASDKHSLASNDIYDILCDSKGRMWIATYGGGLDLAVRKGSRYVFRHFLNNGTGLGFVSALLQDRQGLLWVATNAGLVIMNPDHPDQYKLLPLLDDQQGGVPVVCLCPEGNGGMWAGTRGHGLYAVRYDRTTQQWKQHHYTMKDGLAGNYVQAIEQDRFHRLWIATQTGLSVLHTDSRSFETIPLYSSVMGQSFNENCSFMAPDGRLFFGTNYGIVSVLPTADSRQRHSIKVTLTALKINGIDAGVLAENSPLDTDISYADQVTLAQDQNTLRIDFSTLDYGEEASTQYQYWLEGLTETWGTPTNDNYALFHSLPAGHYTLHVRARLANGPWSQESKLRIRVRPYWYASAWAWTVYIILMLVVGGYIVYTIVHMARLRFMVNVEKRVTEYKLRFFTNISHEYRTPLTLILGATEHLQSLKGFSAEARNYLNLIRRNGDRLMRLANQLIEFRKLGSRGLQLKVQSTDIISFVGYIAETFQDLAKEKQLAFSYKPFEAVHRMLIDQEKVDKMVYNLLSNAFKYTPAGGSVTFTIKKEDSLILLQCTDTGPGVEKEKQPLLFTSEMDADPTHDSMGLGLSLTAELVRLHHGAITYADSPVGGSIFTIALPDDDNAYSDEERMEASDNDHSQQEAAGSLNDVTLPEPMNDKHVLIIDDEPDVANFLQQQLSPYFQVTTRFDGTSGLKCAQEEDFDLIVCDVMMPGMDGYEVTRRLKGDFQSCHIPIILLTALSTENDQFTGIKAGADTYLTKPFSPRLLLAYIVQLIQQRQRIRKRFEQTKDAQVDAIATTDLDRQFLNKFNALLKEHLADSEFTLEQYASELAVGRTVFFRKIKGLTGSTPNEFIRVMRLKQAAALLTDGHHNVLETAYEVGFNDPLYFSRCFKAQFGVSPKKYMETQQ